MRSLKYKSNCPNMNHGKANAMVKYCPNCGEIINSSLSVKCDKEKHSSRRKSRDLFCVDCGVSLT